MFALGFTERNKMPPSQSPIPYTGNKSCIYEQLKIMMPFHTLYIEPCMGSAEIFFRKAPAQKSILNDYNGDVTNFFRVLRDDRNLAEFIGMLYLSGNCEFIFQENRKLLFDTPNILDECIETAMILKKATASELHQARAFFENQTYSFSSTGKSFAIAERDIARRLPRLVSACAKLHRACILHRDYKDVIAYAACPNALIFLDPPYLGTEDCYQKANFDSSEHEKLFEFMFNEVHKKYDGKCKFIITYNNHPSLTALADKHGFPYRIIPRLHNMQQSTNPGAIFEELVITNYDWKAQIIENCGCDPLESQQISLFDDYTPFYLNN